MTLPSLNRWTGLGMALRLALALALALPRAATARPHPHGLAAGGPAPAFSLRDVDGRPVRLTALRGKVVVVNFWATWCGPCLEEAPALAALWRAHHARGLEVLGVAEESGGAAELQNAALMLQLPYPVLVDEDGAAADRYRVPGYPFTFVVDARGRIRHVFDGALAPGALEAAVAPLLPPPPRPSAAPPAPPPPPVDQR